MRKFLFIIFFLPILLHAQNYSDAQIKAAYIYNFIVNIEWSNEDDLSEFDITVFGEDTAIVPYLRSLAKTKTIRGLPIKIHKTTEFDDLLYFAPEVIFLTEDNASNIKRVYYEVLSEPVLIISDNANQQLYVMLNFIKTSNNKISFELNTKNIEDQSLKILPKLLVLGGTELDVKKLLKLKEQELQQEKDIVKQQEQKLLKQQSLIDSQLVSINKQNEIIEKRRKSIDSLVNQVQRQTEVLNLQSRNLEQLQLNVKTQQNILNQKIQELRVQKDSIDKQKILIHTQQAEIQGKLAKLDSLNADINQRQAQIDAQKSELSNLHGTVESQRKYMGFMGVILLLVIFIIFYVYNNFRQKKKLNDKLVQKNNEVEAQSEELQQINQEITTQRDHIQHQNEFITGSISYSKRIQEAILPSFVGLRKSFDTFLIYKPKDIVSGDFYWGAEIISKDFNYKFVAVVDCTGHGVPGALLSIVGSRLLSEIVNQHKIYDPAKILTMLNLLVVKTLKQKETNTGMNDGMDVVLCRIEMLDNKYNFTFAGAKRALFYYNSEKKEVERIKGSRLTIGGYIQNKNEKFENRTFIAHKNDTIYLMTDGYIDQNNKERKRFGSPRVKRLIAEIGHLSASEQYNAFEQKLNNWQKEEMQRDDITLLGLRIK